MRPWVWSVVVALAGCATLGTPAPTVPGPEEPARAEPGVTPPPGAGAEADVAAAVKKLEHGDATGARTLVQRHARDASDFGASFLLGVTESRLGNGRRAVALLEPFDKSGPPAVAG